MTTIDRAGATTSRLTIDDWVRAGFAIRAEEGITALKVDRLCNQLAVTKGSFYWHFSDIADYRAALIGAWSELRDEDRSQFGEMARMPPRERLSQMMSSLLSTRHWTLERAIREWARTDDAVAAGIHTKKYGTFAAMGAAPATSPDISPEFVSALAERAQEAEELRKLPDATVDDFVASGLADLLVPARYGDLQAPWSAILDPVRRMAHGCASSAWTLGFYTLHNWMMALFGEQAQEEAFATRPFLAAASDSPVGGRGQPA